MQYDKPSISETFNKIFSNPTQSGQSEQTMQVPDIPASYYTTQQAVQADIQNGSLAQDLNTRIATATQANISTLSNLDIMGTLPQSYQALSGAITMSANSQGYLRIGGVNTKAPFSQFQQAMQNPQTRTQFANMMAGIYPGYSISYAGSVIGLVYGFVDGFIALYVLAWLYNKFENKK
jgi:hypothetical protein